MELRVGDLAETTRWTPAGLIGRDQGPNYLMHLDPGTILLITEIRLDRERSPKSCICYEATTGNRYVIPSAFLTMINTHTTED